MRLLLIEDDPLGAYLLEAALSEAGHVVTMPQATAARALHAASGAAPELSLLPSVLADGGCGAALAEALHARHGCPALLMDGEDMPPASGPAALGRIAAPMEAEDVVRCVAAAERRMRGLAPGKLPEGLEFA
jgi:CheY-like chemotaxis protein